MTKYLSTALLICVVALVVSVRSCIGMKADRNRLSDNQRSLFESVEFFRTKDSLSVASIEALTLSNREFERYCAELVDKAHKLGIKVKRLQSVSVSATESTYHIQTPIIKRVDSPRILSDTVQVMRSINYTDKWLRLAAMIIDDSVFVGDITTYDTLTTIAHRVPKRFWFIRYGCKAIRQEVLSSNPHTQITYTEYIELTK